MKTESFDYIFQKLLTHADSSTEFSQQHRPGPLKLLSIHKVFLPSINPLKVKLTVN